MCESIYVCMSVCENACESYCVNVKSVYVDKCVTETECV